MPRTVKVDAFRVEVPGGEKFEEILRRVWSLPRDRRANVAVRGDFMRLQALEERPGAKTIDGDLMKIRMNLVPVKADLDGQTEDIELEKDEGLGYETAFLYHPGTKALLVQRNRTGPSASAFAAYLQEIGGLEGELVFLPIIRREMMKKLTTWNMVQKIEVAFAGIDRADYLKGMDLDMEEVADFCKKFKAPSMKIVMSMGHQEGSLAMRVKDFLKKLVVNVPDDSDLAVRTVKVSGSVTEDDETETIDLLGGRMESKFDLTDEEARRAVYQTRIARVRDVWVELRDEVLELYAADPAEES